MILFLKLALNEVQRHSVDFRKRLIDEGILAAATVILLRLNTLFGLHFGLLGVFFANAFSKAVLMFVSPEYASGNAIDAVKHFFHRGRGRLTFWQLIAILSVQTSSTMAALQLPTFSDHDNTCDFQPQMNFIALAFCETIATLQVFVLRTLPTDLTPQMTPVMTGLICVARTHFAGIGAINLSIHINNTLLCQDLDGMVMLKFALVPLATAYATYKVEMWSTREAAGALLPPPI
uniref:Na_H_Exchanger domain-containing protein n=1 Tax=Panagrellus redivivus TaxID=6233 RepID=A0A7E4VWM5_PANRE